MDAFMELGFLLGLVLGPIILGLFVLVIGYGVIFEMIPALFRYIYQLFNRDGRE